MATNKKVSFEMVMCSVVSVLHLIVELFEWDVRASHST